MKLNLALLSAMSLTYSASAFIVLSLGTCPNIPTKSDFELDKYLGKWYSYENFDAPFQWGSTCVNAEYSIKPNGRIRVINDGFREIKIFGRTIHRSSVRIEGEAFVVDQQVPAALNVRFGEQPDDGTANYLIVDTDYNNYSVVYSCNQFGILKIELAWILTRQQGVPPSNRAALMANLEGYGVDTKNFKKIDHSNCS